MQIMRDDSMDGIDRVESGTETEHLSAHVQIHGQNQAVAATASAS